MVLIFNPFSSFTIYKLLDILISRDISFKVIDPTNIFSLSIKQGDGTSTSIIINGEQLDLSSISSIFSTSSNLNLRVNFDGVSFTEFDESASILFLNSEWRKLNEYIAYILQHIPHLSLPYDPENKLKTNEIAKMVGFKIPNSIISTESEAIKSYFAGLSEKSFIAKRISEFLSGETVDGTYYQHESAHIPIDNLNQFPKSVFPSTSQQVIDFIYEIRCLYVDGCISSVVRYSHSYTVDMPFSLPEFIKSKIVRLMQKLNLKFGSIDLLIDNFENYYFLEVNPHGQFDLISVLGDFDVYQQIFDFIYEKEKCFICNSKKK